MSGILIDCLLVIGGEGSEIFKTLDEVRASAEFEIFREVEKDEEVIERITSAQREELEREIAELNAEAERTPMKHGNWRERCRFEGGKVRLYCGAEISPLG